MSALEVTQEQRYAKAITLVNEVLELLHKNDRGRAELLMSRRVMYLARQTPAEGLRIARENMRFTKAALARRAGVSRDTIRKAETDGPETLQLTSLVAIAQVLDETVDTILHHGVTPRGVSIYFEGPR